MNENSSVAARFEAQVRASPDNLALGGGGYDLTYVQLNHAANRLAHAIRARRAGYEEPVALLMDHGVSIIIAVLAVLKAGKFYVAIDQALPPPRRRAILENSRAGLIVADSANIGQARELAGAANEVLNADTFDGAFPDTDPSIAVAPDAYLNIMYTSGTTGEPKGVLQSQRSLLRVYEATGRPPITERDRVALTVSHSFGASAATAFRALLTGAALLPFDVRREGVRRLADWLNAERITIYHSVPTLFRNLFAALGPDERLTTVRQFHLGGEPLFKRDVEMFRRHTQPEALVRLVLGTTETYVSAWNFIDHQTALASNIVPVGYAPPGVEMLVLDDQRRPVPAGEIGELATKSEYLSPGYWQRPDLTAAAFIPDPRGGDDLVYLMGDVGRMRSDGCVEHLGRKDGMVKVRGRQVALGEIEFALRSLEGVKDAVVVGREDAGGEKRVAAYWVPASNPAPAAGAMREALAVSLADYMLPSVFVTMEKLPLLPTGKVDIRALPTPDWQQPARAAAYVAPRTPLEELLAQTWAEVLGVSRVGIRDNFIELGGDSLRAALIVARVSQACSIDLAPGAVMDVFTVSALAPLVAQQMAARASVAEVNLLLDQIESLSDAQDAGPGT